MGGPALLSYTFAARVAQDLLGLTDVLSESSKTKLCQVRDVPGELSTGTLWVDLKVPSFKWTGILNIRTLPKNRGTFCRVKELLESRSHFQEFPRVFLPAKYRNFQQNGGLFDKKNAPSVNGRNFYKVEETSSKWRDIL